MSENEKNLTEQEWVDVARSIIVNDSDFEYAGAHYFKAEEKNPQNAEATFFAAYMSYKSLLGEGDTASATRAFRAMAENAAAAVEAIKEYQGVAEMQGVVAGAVAIVFTPVTRYVFTKLHQTAQVNIEKGVLALYALGDALQECFGDSATIVNLAVEAWKEGIALQRQYYAYKYEGVNPEEYAAKIQKVEPTYTMPKKSGCISFSI